MIIAGSAILFAFGMAILFVQTIRIAFGLSKIAYYLIKLAVCLVVLVLCAFGLFCQWMARWLKPEPDEPQPAIPVNFYPDGEGVIDLPRASFRRG
jgi:hypothetical protein